MNKGKVYAASDFHGNWELTKQVLDYLQPEDRLYFLGDATDRGESGVKVFQALINDPRVVYLKGNHDQMMADAIPFVWGEIEDINYYGGHGYSLWYQNGGDKTARDFWKMTKEEVYAIKKAVDKMPTELRYTSPAGHTVIMEHAGYTPFDIPHRSHDPLWDRDHFYDRWVGPENFYLVHGHTPTMYLRLEYGYDGMKPLTKTETKHRKDWWKEENKKIMTPEIIQYCSGHKFCIDMCTIVSGRIALLDLDTFEALYFDAD